MKYLSAHRPIGALAIALLTAGIASANQQTVSTGPRLKCSTENFNYGFVPKGATVSHTYWVRNTGTETAIIKQLKPNCGCTQVPPTDSSIAPGDSLPVEVLFGSRNMSGKVEKFTRIVSNAQGRVPALTFVAMVKAAEEIPGPAIAVPAIVELNDSWNGATTVKNKTKSAVTLTVVDAPPGLIRLTANEITLGPEESKEIAFEFEPQKSDSEFTKSVTIEANDANRTRLTIPITMVRRE